MLDPVRRILDSVSWIHDPGWWIKDPCSLIMDIGSRILDLGSRFQDPGFWIIYIAPRTKTSSEKSFVGEGYMSAFGLPVRGDGPPHDWSVLGLGSALV